MDVVESAQIVVSRRPDAIFLVIGDGDCRAMMEDACAARSSRGFPLYRMIDHE